MSKRLPVLLSCLVGLMAGPVFAAGEWPQFRGPDGQGISTAKNVPIEWSDRKNVAWKLDIPGQAWSSPVLSDGKLYLTTAAATGGGPINLWALCVDAETGKVLWNISVFQPEQQAITAKQQKNSLASPTPIVTGDRLYVHFGHMGTAALDLSGKIIWRQTSLKYSPIHGNGGSPLLLSGSLIFSCDAASNPFVVALDAATGDIKWKTPRNTSAHKTFSFCTPLAVDVDGQTQVILPGSGFVGGYDPANGRELWRVMYGEGYSVVPRPVFSHGLLFVSSGFDSPIVYAVKPNGAKGNATATNIAWTQRKQAPCTPSMLVVGDELYYVSDGGIATCADAVSGKTHWTHRFDGGFSSSPVLADGHIYFQNESGVGYVIKPGKTFEQIAENSLNDRTLASYAVADGALYIRSDKRLWKISSVK